MILKKKTKEIHEKKLFPNKNCRIFLLQNYLKSFQRKTQKKLPKKFLTKLLNLLKEIGRTQFQKKMPK